MRTMFIPTILLLFCSLTQLTNAVERSEVKGCRDIYECFVPENCLKLNDNGDSSNKGVEQMIDTSKKVNHNCPGLFRVYAYTKYWAQVSIVSFGDDTTSIIFRQKKDSTVNTFECVAMDDGKYNGQDQKALVDEDPIEQAKGKLQCTFDVELMTRKNELFEEGSSYQFDMIVKKKPMVTRYRTKTSYFYGCDVSSFQFNNDLVAEKKFTKVLFKPDRYYCEKEIFKLEYIPKEGCGYVDVTNKITCKEDAYTVGTSKFEYDDSIELRCAADVKYFCKHAIKTKDKFDDDNEKELFKVDGNPDTQKPGELKCPDTYGYLFVDGKLIMNPTFECRNYGGIEYWTVLEKVNEKKGGTMNKTHRLTPRGPVAYCAKTIPCYLKYRIPYSSVKRGTLDSQNLPLCYKRGVLYVGDDEVTSKRCDSQTGDFKYELRRMKGVEQLVTDRTKFECRYPVQDDEAQNKADNDALALAGGVGITICIAVVVVIVTGMVFLSRRHIRKMNLKYEKEAYEKFRREELSYKHYAYTKDEKRQLKMAQNPGENYDEEDDGVDEKDAPASAPCADQTEWSELVMDFCCDTEKRLMPTNSWGKELIGIQQKSVLGQDHALKKSTMHYKHKSDVKITEYCQPREFPRMTKEFADFQEKFQRAKIEGLKR